MMLSFICPCYNEEANVEPFLRSISDSFPVTEDYEVVFINDGSTDTVSYTHLTLPTKA